ncbi:MAG TPA: hypothetical protein VL551_01760 [Actinospica sp.]|jgi:uncharacterized protein YukE|nr:hypothetical protein [Actinospica sp.]
MRIGDSGSDFEVDPAQLGGVAGRLGRAYDDFNTAIVDDDSAYTDPAAFGDPTVGQAWQSFDSAWAAEMSTYAEALAEMVRNVETTAQRYRETEQSITENLRGIGAR